MAERDKDKGRRNSPKTGRGGGRGSNKGGKGDGSPELYRKDILGTLAGMRGEVSIEHEIVQRRLHADILFVPVPELRSGEDLGLLDRMLDQGGCIMELYSRTPGAKQGWDCLAKHTSLRSKAKNHAKRKGTPVPPGLHLWIISPGHPQTLIQDMGMIPAEGWPPGLWHMHGNLHVHLVAVRLLPVERDTLYLRLLGRGKVLAGALRELESMSGRARRELGDVVVAWHDEIVETTDKDKDVMLLAQTKARIEELKSRSFNAGIELGIEQGIEQGIELGMTRGEAKGERTLFLKMLSLRFGPLPAAVQSRVKRAKVASLERWAERLFEARTLSDVFQR